MAYDFSQVDIKKIHQAKNEDLMAMADELKIEYDATAFNRGEVVNSVREYLKNSGLYKKTKRVIFHNTAEKSGDAVVVGLNGKLYHYPRDVEVDVPEEVLAIVDESFEWRIDTLENGQRIKRKFKPQTYSIVS